ncbi:MAG: DUF362 domain-containing protein [Desulfatiglandaceae bacterium]
MDYPRFQFIKQRYPDPRPVDIQKAVAAELAGSGLLDPVQAGQKVAITAGSRGISAKPAVLRVLAGAVKAKGADPFLMPAMGSHGGGTGPGQVEVLQHIGITEAHVGAPIYDGWDLVELGRVGDLVTLYVDRAVTAADHVIVVNRIKEHTEYKGPTESGLIKMMAIGLGRQPGAEQAHALAVNLGYYQALHAMAAVMFERLNILGGVGILEDQRNTFRRVAVLKAADMTRGEARLMAESRTHKPKLPFDTLDFLIIDQIGKEISGTGADTKVVGRIMNIYEEELKSPHITRILVRDLSDDTDGNAIGIGLADYTTRRCVDRINPAVTALNAITGCTPEKGRIPLTGANDEQAFQFVLRTIGVWQPETVRGAWIKNSKDLEVLAVTPALAKEALGRDDLEVLGRPMVMPFDDEGNLPRNILGLLE